MTEKKVYSDPEKHSEERERTWNEKNSGMEGTHEAKKPGIGKKHISLGYRSGNEKSKASSRHG